MTQDPRGAGSASPERRRMLISVGVAVILMAIGIAALANALGQGPTPAASGTAAVAASAVHAPTGWVRLPDPPLSARRAATAVWVASSVVIVGGFDGAGCPANADCAIVVGAALSDGARYEATSGSWTSIAPAPVPIGYAETAIVGRTAYFWVFPPEDGLPTFMAYDIATDSWTRLPLPPAIGRVSPRLVATADAVIAYPSSNELGDRVDRAFDVASGTWHDLPADPLTPSFDRTIVVSGERLISLGPQNVRDPGVKPPVYRAAILDLASGEWRRLHDAPIVANDSTWFVAGNLLVNPSLGGADGGQTNNWGRTIPFGGMFDLEGEAWIGLPNPPPEGQSFAGGPVAGGEVVVNRQGWSLNVDTLSWQRVGGPPRGPDSEAAAVWAGDHLFLFGGSRTDGNAPTLLGAAWEWRPGGS